MTISKSKPGARVLGWTMMLAGMAIMLASIFSDLIRPGVAVPIGAMFLLFSLIQLGAFNEKEDSSSPADRDLG